MHMFYLTYLHISKYLAYDVLHILLGNLPYFFTILACGIHMWQYNTHFTWLPVYYCIIISKHLPIPTHGAGVCFVSPNVIGPLSCGNYALSIPLSTKLNTVSYSYHFYLPQTLHSHFADPCVRNSNGNWQMR